MARFYCLVILTPLALLACEDRSGSGTVSVSVGTGPFTCTKPIDATLSREVAQQCAEGFVARQGYASAPPLVDSTTIVYEFIEPASTWREALTWRHNTLSPSAVAVCDLHPNWFQVVFAAPDATSPHGRAVRVRKDFRIVEIVHQGFILATLKDSTMACTPVQ